MAQAGQGDADLVGRFVAGEPDAFGVLVKRYKGLTYTIILKLVGDRETAEDLLQETFVRVYRAMETMRSPEHFKAWLLRIATNEAIKYLRRKNPTSLSLDGKDEGSERLLSEAAQKVQSGQLETLVDRHFELGRVGDKIRKLPMIYRNAVVLRYFADLSYKEICDVVGANLATVKFRIHYGLKLLRAYLTEE